MSARNEAKERLMDELAAMSDDEFEARCKWLTDEINANNQNKQPLAPRSLTPCTWRSDEEDHWTAACGLAWWICDGTPAENNINFCPKCGGRITEVAL